MMATEVCRCAIMEYTEVIHSDREIEGAHRLNESKQQMILPQSQILQNKFIARSLDDDDERFKMDTRTHTITHTHST